MVATLKLLGADGAGGGVDAGGGVGLVGVEGASLPEQPTASITTTVTPHDAAMRWTMVDRLPRVLMLATVEAIAKRIPRPTFSDCVGFADR